MTDIAPAMQAKIMASFQRRMAEDADLTRIAQAIAAGTATHAETQLFAVIIGGHASAALLEYVTPGELPDERFYYNIANRVVRAVLDESRSLVNGTASQVQETLYKAAGVGLKPVVPVPNKWRVDDLISKMANAEKFEAVSWTLDAPVKNTVLSFADDFIQENVKFQAAAGLQPTVTRTASAGCCPWCADRAGQYDAAEAERAGVYRRHERCKCQVVATVRKDTGWRRQDVWTKRWIDPAETAKIEARKTVGLE